MEDKSANEDLQETCAKKVENGIAIKIFAYFLYVQFKKKAIL